MKFLLFILIILVLNNCSLNKNSKFWTEDNINKLTFENNLKKILDKSNNIMKMSFNEYKIYIDDYNKKSNYPDISK